MKTYKLLGEQCEYDRHDYELLQEAAESGEKHWYIKGPYTEADRRNRNGRIYPLNEMVKQVQTLNDNYIKRNMCTR